MWVVKCYIFVWLREQLDNRFKLSITKNIKSSPWNSAPVTLILLPLLGICCRGVMSRARGKSFLYYVIFLGNTNNQHSFFWIFVACTIAFVLNCTNTLKSYLFPWCIVTDKYTYTMFPLLFGNGNKQYCISLGPCFQ